jgi:hypothetical protein
MDGHRNFGSNGGLYGSSQNSITYTKTKPYVINNTDYNVWYKPEGASTAIPLLPGMKTFEKIDGLNANGTVWKITDNYRVLPLAQN